MAIYTGKGDDGSTRRLGGGRVRKDDPSIEAVGAIDELNAHLGLCLACGGSGQAGLSRAIEPVQSELFAIGSALSVGTGQPAGEFIGESAVRRLESQIDATASALPELKGFVLPGGCELACRLHVARAVCRRAERAVAALAGGGFLPVILPYLNRLGDLLFVLARQANRDAGLGDLPRKPC